MLELAIAHEDVARIVDVQDHVDRPRGALDLEWLGQSRNGAEVRPEQLLVRPVVDVGRDVEHGLVEVDPAVDRGCRRHQDGRS
ncbi:MAG TPA: hypothetical protein VGD76_12560, partial [Ramlibacter sp.]